MKKRVFVKVITLLIIACSLFGTFAGMFKSYAAGIADDIVNTPEAKMQWETETNPYIEVMNNNVPFFVVNGKITCSTDEFEEYSDLDLLGRCTVAFANISKATIPFEERGEIGHIKPSGWQTVKYPELIKGMYLYNRCHLIAYCLAGENDNEKNLITGTRYLNTELMYPYEVAVAKYMDNNPDAHVLYRVTPQFIGDELVARGVLMEAYSVEDNGAGICFNVFLQNVQPGIEIDYATGDSKQVKNAEEVVARATKLHNQNLYQKNTEISAEELYERVLQLCE